MKQDKDGTWHEDPIHYWFGLSYASYLVLPRSVMESMPIDWQERMVSLLNEINDARSEFLGGNYAVNLRRCDGRIVKDPLADYRHPLVELPQKEAL